MKENVYVFRLVGTDFYKIGMTKNESIKDRLQSIKTYTPFQVDVTTVIKTKNALLLEKEIHKKFDSKRINGEFFELTKNDIIYLKSLEDVNTKKLKDFFWTEIISNEIDLNLLKSVMKSLNIKLNDNFGQSELNEKIYDFLEINYYDYELTNSEIFNLLEIESNVSLEGLSNKMLGSILIKKYSQKTKNIEGSTKRVYKIC